MRLALWIALIVPVAAMVMGLKTKKYAWNCALSVSCAAIVLLTGRGMAVAPLAAGLLVSVAGDYFMSHKAGREKMVYRGHSAVFRCACLLCGLFGGAFCGKCAAVSGRGGAGGHAGAVSA